MIDLLPCCSILRIPFDFQDGAGYIQKLFVVIGHQQNCAIAFKATSKLERYGDNPHQCKGVVFLHGPEPFILPTVVDPSKAFAIPHSEIEYEQKEGRIRIWSFSEDLQAKLCLAIDQNHTLTKSRKLNLKQCLGCAS